MIINKRNLVGRVKKCKCSNMLIAQINQCSTNINDEEILHILKEYQKNHQQLFDIACQHIDCIDFLIYEIEKEKST